MAARKDAPLPKIDRIVSTEDSMGECLKGTDLATIFQEYMKSSFTWQQTPQGLVTACLFWFNPHRHMDKHYLTLLAMLRLVAEAKVLRS